MIRIQQLERRPRCFRSFTGLTVEEFHQLVVIIKPEWKKGREKRLKQEDRKRKKGGGRKQALATIEDQLLLTLVWARIYPVYLILEFFFGIDESTVCRTIQTMTILLRGKFTLPERIPRRKIRTLEELKALLPPDIGLDEILGDATEQKILRPKDKRKRRRYHSGKKQAFTQKTQIAVNRKGYIIHVADSVGGRMHDYRLFQNSGLPQLIPQTSTLYLDNGYQGIKKDYPNLQVKIPYKRSRKKQDLTRCEKIFNKKQRRVRITIENTFAHLKKYQVLNQTFRHDRDRYHTIFSFVANIFNFRLLSRGLA